MRWLTEAVLRWQLKDYTEAYADLFHCYHDLQAQLVEAREENERLRLVDRDVDREDQVVMEAMGKRDAAIERGVAVWKGAEQQRGMLLLLPLDENCRARRRP